MKSVAYALVQSLMGTIMMMAFSFFLRAVETNDPARGVMNIVMFGCALFVFLLDTQKYEAK